jgi:mono/diheme cytochrome c family protein
MKRAWLLAGVALGALSTPNSGLAAEDAQNAARPDAAEDYLLNCSACHTRDGGGTPGLVPSLRELAPLLAHPQGRAYLVRVPGVAQAPLSDARVARLLNWVLDEYSNLRLEPPYGAAEVANLRASPLRDPLGFRATLVENIENSPPPGPD